MSELGIACSGPRPIVEKRHKEWTTLWNSNCDSANPKTKAQLLQDLDVWERTLGSRALVAGRAAQNAALVKDKDFDGKATS
ncbi:Postreplication repair E3 ubiquitin-protein ligase rad18 [Escovopsis weberi]|uniref:Postreplication repair E3 ubiquitin-protein ligase rad18 n=1 Tax=Escovopsis weberi TaxID=150374 RepID=A0A0N0RTQ2_ESCWE|nr:Postreplication repair E3 ubiquitin-protein ligase rad18 [Escovopsis weberi]